MHSINKLIASYLKLIQQAFNYKFKELAEVNQIKQAKQARQILEVLIEQFKVAHSM